VVRSAVSDALKFIMMARGRARLTTDGGRWATRSWAARRRHPEQPVEAETPGLHRRQPSREIEMTAGYSVIRDDDADYAGADVVLGGHIDLNRR
jgi:hypothetical protein